MKEYTFQNRLLLTTLTAELKNVSLVLDKTDNLVIDLSNISSIDSAGIALLIELKNIAKQKNKQLFYNNPTEDITRLCKLYRVTI
ncbi:MAG: lipid asymmetry maintenance protein MlaB [Neisseriaceae bacterium]|jgi:anti-anti-sigma factor